MKTKYNSTLWRLLSLALLACTGILGSSTGHSGEFLLREKARARFHQLKAAGHELEEAKSFLEVPQTITKKDAVYKRAGELLSEYETKIDDNGSKDVIEVLQGELMIEDGNESCNAIQTFVLFQDPWDHQKADIKVLPETKLVRDCGAWFDFGCNYAYIRIEYVCHKD